MVILGNKILWALHPRHFLLFIKFHLIVPFRFIDSTLCELDGKKMLYFKHPARILESAEDTLAKIGPEQFFKNPNKEVKQVRESMAALFFLLALQKDTKSNWFFMQPQDDPPDFILVNVGRNPIDITFEAIELVEIPVRCQTFEEMMGIIQKKLKSGYPQTYNLLIFINHEKSKEWLPLLNSQLNSFNSFKTVWTVHLLWFKEKGGLWGSIVNRLRPEPVRHIEAGLDDTQIGYPTEVPAFMESIEREGKTIQKFKDDFVKAFRIKFKEFKNNQNKNKV